MKIDPRKTYTLHKDSDTDKLLNIRLHLPLKTNKQSYLTFLRIVIVMVQSFTTLK